MTEEALNLSLDDIIKRNAEQKKTSGTGLGGRRGGRGGSRGGRGSSLAPKALAVQTRVTKTIRGRGQGRGGPRASTRENRNNFLRDAPRDQEALEGNKSWEHDMYAEIPRLAPRRPAQQQQAVAAPDGTKLQISNLDRNVTDNDIKELFQACGELKKWGVKFDTATGVSRGLAFVYFTHAQDAQRALEQYNGVALDGKPMKIEFESSTNRKLSSGISVGGIQTSGRLVQHNRVFAHAAGAARIGRNKPYGSGMRSTVSNRMEED